MNAPHLLFNLSSVYGLREQLQKTYTNALRVHAGSEITFKGDVYPVEEFYLHPKYDRKTNDYDVAMVVIKGKFNARRNQTPLPLATNPNIDALAGKKGVVMGFGQVSVRRII